MISDARHIVTATRSSKPRPFECAAIARKCVFLAVILALAAGRAAADEPPAPTPETVIRTAAKDVESGALSTAVESLVALDGRSLPVTLRAQADLLLGVVLLRQGELEEAAKRLEAASSHPVLADYALYHLAHAHSRAGRPDLAAETLRQLVERHPQSLLVDRAGREMAREYMDAGQLVQAEAAARAYLGASPSTVGRAEVRFILGQILLLANRPSDAEDIFHRLWLELPGTPESERAKEILAFLPDVRPFATEEQFQRAATLYQIGRYGQAMVELPPLVIPGSPWEARARLMLGISAFQTRQYNQAIQWLEPLKDQNVAGAEQFEALFWLGRSAGRIGDTARFTECLTLVADAVPHARRSDEALYLLAQAAADDADIGKSRSYLRRLLKDYPKGLWADVALWRQGWFAYKERDFGAAAASWERLVADVPGSRWRVPALYWRGRALEGEKRPAEAARVYRTLLDTSPDQHYYRLHAAQRLTVLTKKKLALHPAPPQPATAQMANGLHAQKARALRELGLVDDAVEEWSEQVRQHPDESAGLAEACARFLDVGRFDKALWVGSRVVQPLSLTSGETPPIPGLWQCAYPLGHIDAVRQNAGARAIDPFLVLALIREESAFSPRAVSRTGALGLMQLMPQTGDLTAREHKLPPLYPGALETPDVNIQLGVNHLADLLRDLGGNLIVSVAAYNAGKPSVQRWLQRFGFDDELAFVEDIPFNETRNYVKRVLGSYDQYKYLYGTEHHPSRQKAGRAKPSHKTR